MFQQLFEWGADFRESKSHSRVEIEQGIKVTLSSDIHDKTIQAIQDVHMEKAGEKSKKRVKTEEYVGKV